LSIKLDSIQKDIYLKKNKSYFITYFNKHIFKYDLKKATWSKTNLSKEITTECNAFCDIGNECLVITGGIEMNNPNVTSASYRYDSTKKELGVITNMCLSRYNHAMMCILEDVFVMGGITKNSIQLKAVEKFNLNENKWVKMSNMRVERASPKVCFSYKANKLYVFGGLDDNNVPIKSIETYDIKTDRWLLIDVSPNFAQLLNRIYDVVPIIEIDTFYWTVKTEDILILADDGDALDALVFNAVDKTLNLKREYDFSGAKPIQFHCIHDNVLYVFGSRGYSGCKTYDVFRKQWSIRDFRQT